MENQQYSATVIDFLFIESFFDWVAKVQNFFTRSKSPTTTTSNKAIALTDNNFTTSNLKKLEHEVIEHVMEKLGLGFEQETYEHTKLTFNDVMRVFEENEPCLDEVKAAFCVFDQNNDGFIDEYEMKRVMAALGFKEASRPEICRMMIGEYDQNGDGLIDFFEFVKVVEKSFC